MRIQTMINRQLKQIALGIALLSSASGAFAVDQFANSVINFSSQYSSTYWSAAQALGAPDTSTYGDNATAWAPTPANGTLEYITLGFATPVYASSAIVRETYGNGFVYQIDVRDQSNALHTVWTGTDSSQPGTPVDAAFSWATTSYLVTGLKIYTNTNHNLNAWEEIDAVTLNGQSTAPVPEPETYAMMLVGLGLLGFAARRRKQKEAVA
jgi:hypothetical protein